MTGDAIAALAELGQKPSVAQVGILVRDLESAARAYGAAFGIARWTVYTYEPGFVPELTYRGEPGHFSARLALGGSDPQIELVEPLQGPSIYHEWLEEHGEGLHHLAVRVDSLEESVRRATERGIDVLQSGRGYGVEGDGGFAYLDTEGSPLGLILEFIEVPKVRRPPEAVWGTEADAEAGAPGQSS